jgi:stress response protein SCP2
MFNKDLNSISLRRKFKIQIPIQANVQQVVPELVGAFVSNVKQYGFILDANVVNDLLNSDKSFVVGLHTWLISELRKLVGANKAHKPMYPNFPEQVASASDAELYFNAIMHYSGYCIGQRIMPDYETNERPAYLEGFGDCDLTGLKVIGSANFKIWDTLLIELLGSKATPSETDKTDITVLLANGVCPSIDSIPCKETLAFVFTLDPWMFVSHVKTATDVLRIAVALSKGDISLAKKTKFINFKREQRRMLLTMLNLINPDFAGEDMMRYRAEWKRLGEKLHPGEYAKQYPNAALVFSCIRNEGCETFASKVEKEIKSGASNELLQLLKTRPGDFGRRLDKILRMSKHSLPVVQAFGGIVDKISAPVLHQLYSHFWTKEKLAKFDMKICFPKGQEAKAMEFSNFTVETDADDEVAMLCRNELMLRYKELPAMGKVWVDPIVNGILLPMGSRGASNALYQVARGSRFKLGSEKNTVRLFMWWKDLKADNGSGDRGFRDQQRVDLDLSAMLMDDKFNYIGQCSWTDLRYGNGKNASMVHSGDITSAPQGASEFLDVNLDMLDANVRYIAMAVTCYTGQPMKNLDEAFCGVMLREHPNSGEIYDPRTVATRMDLRTDATQTLPALFDVKTREIIFADLTLNNRGWGHAVHNSRDKQALACDSVARLGTLKPRLSDLILWHVIARGGEFVETREEAEFVIAADGDLNPFDLTKISSEWV